MTKALATNGAKKVYILGRRKPILDQVASELVNSPAPKTLSIHPCSASNFILRTETS